MRNALLHAGSTTAYNVGKTHRTHYTHFSFVDPETFDFSCHESTSDSRASLNVHLTKMAGETTDALKNWFAACLW